MKMYIKSVMVSDQQKALEFYTEKLGFAVKNDIPMGEFRWLTLVSPEEPEGTELGLEPNQYEAAQALQKALYADGIPWTAFSVSDIEGEVAKLKDRGVAFKTEPMKAGGATIATFDDTCGNYIQLIQLD
ncbi:MAG: VOC family protein [Pseudomonadota bacterium]